MSKARRLPPDEIGAYHIYNRGNNGQIVFHDEDDFLIFYNLILKAKEKIDFAIHHYCILQNHYHFVMKSTGSALSKAMHWINYGYSMKHAWKYKRRGRLWQARYKSELLDTPEYLSVCTGYAELNAVKHQIVSDPKDYRWSSYNHYAYGVQDAIVDDSPDYLDLAGTPEERQRIYRILSKKRVESLKHEYWSK
jgi:putative transposase